MNEQINKLAEQAVEETDKIVYHEDYPQWNSTFHQKFAELIVRECTGEIRKQGDGESLDDWDRGYGAGLISAINTLYKHFGVEE